MQVFLAFIRGPPAEQALLGQGDQVAAIQVESVGYPIRTISNQILAVRAEISIKARQDEHFLPGRDIHNMRRRIFTASRDPGAIQVKFYIDHNTRQLHLGSNREASGRIPDHHFPIHTSRDQARPILVEVNRPDTQSPVAGN